MGLISRTGDLFYAFRFLRTLTTPWEKMKAHELGIIDETGKVLKKAKELTSPEEKSAYTVFHRLVFNIKRLLNKLPFGKSKLASYAAALFLIKENTGLTEEEIRKVMSEVLDDMEELEEATWFQEDDKLKPGKYKLTQEIVAPSTGEPIAQPNDIIEVNEFLEPVTRLFEQNIYEVTHSKTGLKIYITNGEIKR
ncbi:MAG: hypothetical protein HKN86_04015 [Acidimicrobiia bacterium]|nr:hypothetical protein [Acidimicrobiia bacterium]